MRCHECARGMIEEVAVGQCRSAWLACARTTSLTRSGGPSSHAMHASTVPSWRMQIAQISVAEAALVCWRRLQPRRASQGDSATGLAIGRP